MKYFLAAILVLLLVIVIGAGAFYFGRQSANQSKEMTTTPTPTTFQTSQTGQTPTPQEVEGNKKLVEAGGVLSFPNYSLFIPSDWSSQEEQGQDSNKLTLTKGVYKITINEAAFGGGGCIYPGQPQVDFAQSFSK